MKKLIIILSCLFFLIGCNNNSEDNKNKEKVFSEVKYFSSEIGGLFNSLNNISFENYELTSKKITINENNSQSQKSSSGEQGQTGSSQGEDSQTSQQSSQSGEKQEISVTDMQFNSILSNEPKDIPWDIMKNQIQLINTSWNIVMIDLYNENVSNENITAFGDLLNKTTISIKNEDKNSTLTNLSNLYSYIPKFLNELSAEQYYLNIETAKYYIFITYADISQDDWSTANENITNAENTFYKVLNDTKYTKDREFKVNKAYMLIKDLNNTITNKDKELFLLKYKNLMESLNTL